MYHCNNNLACSVMSNSLQPYGLEPAWLLCPWAFSGEDEWVAMPSSRRLSQPRDPTLISCLLHCQAFFTTSATWEAHYYVLRHYMCPWV